MRPFVLNDPTPKQAGSVLQGRPQRQATLSQGLLEKNKSLLALVVVALNATLPVSNSVAANPSSIEIDTKIIASIDAQNENHYRAFYDDIDSTSFLRFKNGRVYFAPPFPTSEKQFSLQIIDNRNNEILLNASYKLDQGVPTQLSSLSPADQNDGAPEALITTEGNDDTADEVEIENSNPQVEFSHTGQIDISALGSAEDGSDFESRITEQQGESDLLAGFSVGLNYRSLNTSVQVEGVHRSNDENTVRYEGPRGDISQFVSTLRYGTRDGSIFYLKAGDVDVSSQNSLVNSGMSSRGFSIGFVAPNEKFQWEVGRVYGQDIIGMVRGPLGFSSNSYRIGASAGFKLLNNDNVDWSVRFSMLNAKRDIEDAFASGESQSGEKNTVRGYGTDLSFFNSSLNLSLSWAQSEYDNPSELNEDNVPEDDGLDIFRPGITRGNAYRHSIQWDAWRNSEDTGFVSLEYATERSEPFYRSIHGQATADRRQWSLYADVEAGHVTARFGTTQYQNNLDNLISIHTLDEEVHTAEVTLDVVSWRESKLSKNEEIKVAVPSSIGLRATIEQLQTLNGDQIILAPVIDGFDFMDQETETLGLSLSWEGDTNSTTLDIDYTVFDNSQRERATADTKDLVYSLSHSIYRDKWSLSGRVAISTNDDFDTTSRSSTRLAEYGLSGSYTDQGLTLSGGFDRSLNKFNDRVLNDNEDTTSVAYSISLDFGTWLAQKLSWRIDPSVTASWQRSTTDNRSIYYVNDQTSESFSVNVGVPF